MSDRWSSFSVEAPFPAILPTLVKPLEEVIGAARTAVDAALPLLEIIAALQGLQSSPFVVGFEAFIKLFEGLLADMTSIASCHMLSVPVLRWVVEPTGPPTIPLQHLDQLGILNQVLAAPDETFGGGGNYGLYRVIIESLFDPGDFSRPQFSDDAYVAGALFVYGSDNVLEALLSAMLLNNILGASIPWPTHNHAIPVPQDVRVTVIGTVDFTRERKAPWLQYRPQQERRAEAPPYGVSVKWERPPRIRTHYGWGFKYEAKSWHVFVKEGSPIEAGENVRQYEVGTRNFRWNLLDDGRSAVISGLDPEKTYYVSVGYTVVGTYQVAGLGVNSPSEEKSATYPPYMLSMLSDQLRVRWDESAAGRGSRSATGTPPDWVALKHPLNAFPQFQQLLKEASAGAQQLREMFAGQQQELSVLGRALADKIAAADALVAHLEAQITRLQETFSVLSAGLWWAPFAGQGGLAFLTKTVGELLLVAPDKPPFTKGNEAVGALMFVAGAETPGALANFRAAFDAIQPSPEDQLTIGPEDLGEGGAVFTDATGGEDAPGTRSSTLHDLDVSDTDPC